MIAGVIGACIVTGSLTLWIAVLVWLPVVLGTLRMEERELRNRFGTAYSDYARRVPALFPVQFQMRASGNKPREEL
jgi:protein-S-isoprenylcysteine O-methyltransferase Ste14